MERYSTLWGTEAAGPYARLGSSKRLGNFLTQKIGAANIKDVVELTEKLVTGITMLPGYEKETLINKPLAVVYAPLYLEKKPGMTKGMKGFCTLAVSGLEHRSGMRESSFSHTWFFPREEMLTAGEYNYLDLLMGTQLTTSQDVNLHREGSLAVNLERLPQKMQPVLIRKDLPTVLMTIDALYQKKNAVVILEPGVNFNRRSMEILTQIYSMMQPMLATETGFATYQSQKRILELSADTNVQIYVVPSGTDLSGLPASKFQIMEVANPVKPEFTAVMETLLEWAQKFDWKLRSRAMEHLFAKNNDYTNGDLFVKLSRDFFAQALDLSEWAKDTSKHKTITSLAELQAEDKTETGWKLVPWAKEVFVKKYPALLKDGSVEKLYDEKFKDAYFYTGKLQEMKELFGGIGDREAVNSAFSQYLYGKSLALGDESVVKLGFKHPAVMGDMDLANLISEKTKTRVGIGYEEKLSAKDAQIASQEAQHKQTVEGMKQAHQQQLQAKDSELAAQAQTFAEKETDFQNAWNEREQKYQQKWNDRETVHQTALTDAVNAEKANTAAVQAKLDAADQVHNENIAKLTAEHQTEMEAKKQAAEALQTSLAQEKTENQTLRTSLEQSNADKETIRQQAKAKIQQIQNSLEQEKNENQTLRTSLEQSNNSNADLTRKLSEASTHISTLQNNLEESNRKNSDLLQQYRQATGQEPAERDPKIKIGPFTLYKSGVSLLATVAAVMLLLGALLGVVIGSILNRDASYDLQWSVNGQVGSAGGMGIVKLSHESAEAGETVTVTVTPAEGYQLDNVKSMFGTAVSKLSDTEYTFVMPEREEIILVDFSMLPPPVAVYEIGWSVNGQTGNAGGMGTVELSSTSAEAGATVTVTVIPAEDYQLDEVKCENGTALEQLSDTAYTFVMPESAENILVTFSLKPTITNEDGTINWDFVMETVSWVDSVEADAAAMAEIQGENAIDAEGWAQEVILLPQEWSAEKPYILVLRRADADADTDALKLLKKGWLVVDNGDWCLLVPNEEADALNKSWSNVLRAARDVMGLLNDGNGIQAFACQLEDGRTIDLQEMAAAAGLAEDWWLELDKITVKETERNEVKTLVGTGRTVALAIELTDGTRGGFLDYKGNAAKAQEMLAITEGKGRAVSYVGDFVLVMLNGPEDTASN